MQDNKFIKIEVTRVLAAYHLKLAKWYSNKVLLTNHFEDSQEFEDNRKSQKRQVGTVYFMSVVFRKLNKSLREIKRLCIKGIQSPGGSDYFYEKILSLLKEDVDESAFLGFDAEALTLVENMLNLEKTMIEFGIQPIDRKPIIQSELDLKKWAIDFTQIINIAEDKGSFQAILKLL